MRKWLDKPFMSFIALSICCAGCTGRTNEQKQYADEQTVSRKTTEALGIKVKD